MFSLARREMLVILVAGMLFVGLLYPALLHSRREARDGRRRDEVAAFKRVLEQYYNEHEVYPLEFDASPHRYIVVERDETGAASWYLKAELENSHEPASGYDGDEGRQFNWRHVRHGQRTYYEVCGGGPTCDLDDRRRP